MHLPGILEKTKEVLKLTRFSIFGIHIVYRREPWALGIRFGRCFQMAFSAAGKQEYIESRRKYYQYPQKRRQTHRKM